MKILHIKILLLIIFIEASYAAQQAVVTAEKAIVYADQDLKSPIGHLKKGKTIYVGDNALRLGLIYPLVFAKKIVYIKATDLKLKNDQGRPLSTDIDGRKGLEHNVDWLFKEETIYSLYLASDYGRFQPQRDWDALATYRGEQKHQWINNLHLKVEHRPYMHTFSSAIGLYYDWHDGMAVKYRSFGLDLYGHISPIKSKYFNFDFVLNIAAGNTYFKEGITNEENFFSAHGGLGGLVRLFPYHRVGLYLSYLYRADFHFGEKNYDYQGQNYRFERFSGHAYFAGLSVKLF